MSTERIIVVESVADEFAQHFATICHVNGPTVHDEAQVPFGGVGASGYGRFGGKQGIDIFTETRWIAVKTLPPTLRDLKGKRCQLTPNKIGTNDVLVYAGARAKSPAMR